MYLLLTGSTDTARALIIDEFLTAHSDWKHLAMEDIRDAGEDNTDDILGLQETFMTMVACECAKDARREGFRVIVTCPEAEMIEQIRDELQDDAEIVTVLLGKDDDEMFDYIIDGAESSLMEICRKLDEIIEATPA